MPVLLLLTLTAIDFGRVYLGWVNLQSLSRIAANFAATNPTAWDATPDLAVQATYQRLVQGDLAAINCDVAPTGPTEVVPAPVFPTGTDLGDTAVVTISCEFDIITPVIAQILGDTIPVSADAVFPIKSGGVAGIGVGGPVSNAPNAAFIGTPVSGGAPLDVTFTDQSTNAPATWLWNFGDGNTSNLQNPAHQYTAAGTYSVSLQVTNAAGNDTETKSAYITVGTTSGALDANFDTTTATSGPAPLSVTFRDLSTGGATTWSWDFGDSNTATSQNPTHVYNTAGTYTVTLTVGDGTTTNVETKTGYVVVGVAQCTVPNVSDGTTTRSQAMTAITNAGLVPDPKPPGGPDFLVSQQSPQGGLLVTCGTKVEIKKN